jgi:outer membrane biosynthesis protein TonB
MLRHLGGGRDLQEFPGTADEKLGLTLTAAARGQIAWSTARGRFELTPRRGSRSASLVVGTAVGAALAVGALAALWMPADGSHRPAALQAPAPVSLPVAPGGGLLIPTASVPPVAPKVYSDQVPTAQPAIPTEPVRVVPKTHTNPVPAVQPGNLTEPTRVAEQPVPEQPIAAAAPTGAKEPAEVADQPVPAQPSATATPPVTKQAAVKKPRHKTSKVRPYRTWAGANSYRDERYVR